MSLQANEMLYAFFAAASMAQGLFLAVLVIRKGKGSTTSNSLLAFWIGVLSYLSFIIVLDLTHELIDVPDLMKTSYPLTLLLGPLLYLYTLSLLTPDFKLGLRHVIHLVPALMGLLVQIPFYALSDEQKIEHWFSQKYIFEREIDVAIQVLVLGVYVALTFAMILHYEKTLKGYLSNIEKYRFTWLKTLTFSMLALFTVAGLYVVTHDEAIIFKALPLTLFVMIYVLTFTAMKQCSAFQALHNLGLRLEKKPSSNELLSLSIDEEKAEPTTNHDNLEIKYKKSGLNNGQMETYKEQLMEHLKSNKPYLKPQLKIHDLAKEMNISAHQLSQVMNVGLGKSFYDLINEMRVKEAQERLLDPQYAHLTVLAIAEDVGFCSKSTFNTAFKQITGQTPSACRAQSA